jgi:hypothetical protein
MAEYTYKGFKIFYNIERVNSATKLYKANGYVKCFIDNTSPVVSQKFYTEHPTQAGVKNGIRKMLEEYIDFEWQEFQEMSREN